ncbi:MAG TPA: ATP-binding protein, partial [Acetobacteraceae bacterium]|nr:ATP-binding protein [Acetobacteraceae bacterium]
APSPAVAGEGWGGGLLAPGLTILRPSPPPPSRLQERAREARLAALLSACAESGRPWLLLGHHRGDQAETLLFRALRGSGAAGLAAMAPARAAPAALILRPLLGIPATRLEATCTAHGLAPVRDPSNHDGRFARIRLRRALQPLGEPAEEALAAVSRAFARRRAGFEQAMAVRLAAAVEFHPSGIVRIGPAALGTDELAVAALGRLLRLVGDARHAPPAAAVRRLLARGQGTLGGAWLRPAARGTWLLRPDPGVEGEDRSLERERAEALAGRASPRYRGRARRSAATPRGGALT